MTSSEEEEEEVEEEEEEEEEGVGMPLSNGDADDEEDEDEDEEEEEEEEVVMKRPDGSLLLLSDSRWTYPGYRRETQGGWMPFSPPLASMAEGGREGGRERGRFLAPTSMMAALELKGREECVLLTEVRKEGGREGGGVGNSNIRCGQSLTFSSLPPSFPRSPPPFASCMPISISRPLQIIICMISLGGARLIS